VLSANTQFNNTIQQINSRTPYETVFLGATFGLVVGGITSCVSNVFLCEATDGASTILPAIQASAAAGGLGAVKWVTQNLLDQSVASGQFQQQVANVCSKLPG
jgi:hypothetical protein